MTAEDRNTDLAPESSGSHTTTLTTEADYEPGTAGWSTNIVSQFATLRSDVGLLDIDVLEGHRNAQEYDLELSTLKSCKRSALELLEQLSERGLSWTDVARLLGVSNTTIRKWRKGDPPTGTNLRALGRLTAFLDLLATTYGVEDPAAWLELPLVEAHRVTGIDVYVDMTDGPFLLLDLAWGHELTPADLLDRADASWRKRYPENRYEVVDTDELGPVVRQTRGSAS